MRSELLARLRCPYCGAPLELAENAALVRRDGQVEYGVLGCECCAFPVVAGIPVLVAGDASRAAVRALEAGRHEHGLITLLGLDADRAARFTRPEAVATYRAALDLLGPDAEGTYFFHRFSDPTFVVVEALLEIVLAGPGGGARGGRVLDLCGGSGHVTRVLQRLGGRGAAPPVLADLYLWKLWLAVRFTAPGADAVCCDAEAPLPFDDDRFSLVLLADAFPYVWNKRLCADEMLRVLRADGTLLLPHLHSACGENVAAGNPLTPTGYRRLFATRAPRLFSDARLLDDLVDHARIDLAHPVAPDRLGDAPTFTLLASPEERVFACHAAGAPPAPEGVLAVNPLYRVERQAGRSRLTLAFPAPEYAAEFGACRRYLPEQMSIEGDLTGPLRPAAFGPRYDELRRRRVLLDLPPRYC